MENDELRAACATDTVFTFMDGICGMGEVYLSGEDMINTMIPVSDSLTPVELPVCCDKGNELGDIALLDACMKTFAFVYNPALGADGCSRTTMFLDVSSVPFPDRDITETVVL